MNSLIQEIRERMERKTTDELRDIYLKHNERWWSKETFVAIREILNERGAFNTNLPVYDLGKIGSATDGYAGGKERNMNPLAQEIRGHLEQKTTAELKDIYLKQHEH